MPLLVFGLMLLLIGVLVTRVPSRQDEDKPYDTVAALPAGDTPISMCLKPEIYSGYFGLWTKTREERHTYNTYFHSLLFIDTLVAIVTGLLGATKTSAYPELIRALFLGVLIAAVIISIVWACKLFTLNVVEGSQQTVLRAMELALGLPTATTHFTTQVLPFLESGWKEATGALGMELFQKRQEEEVHARWLYQFSWWAGFWALPFFFIILFAILAYLFYTNPSFIPLPTPTPTPTPPP